jgi:metal-sulfur cluster biosynthetic enzyme
VVTPVMPLAKALPMPNTELPDYNGEESWRRPITEALRTVVDPEVAMSILDVGLVYSVNVTPDRVHVLMTMTSAACPVADMLVGEVQAVLDELLPPDMTIDVELCWEPPWTPERMSANARQFMRW